VSAQRPERDGASTETVIVGAVLIGLVLIALVVLAIGGGPLFNHTRHVVTTPAPGTTG
jgi:hypothetical protein